MRKVLPSELTNTIEQFSVYVHQNEAHVTYIYVYHTNVFEADNTYITPPPNVISPYCFAILFRSWAPTKTLLTVGALTGCPRQLQTCARLMQGWVASSPGAPPPTKILATPVCPCSIHEVTCGGCSRVLPVDRLCTEWKTIACAFVPRNNLKMVGYTCCYLQALIEDDGDYKMINGVTPDDGTTYKPGGGSVILQP